MITDEQQFPQRIISLVPSQTELLFDLGLQDRIVGITKFCVHPAHLKNTKTIIGGTKKVNYEKIRALKPDLIIGNKEENTAEMVMELEKFCPIWVTDIATIEDNSKMILDFGKQLGCEEKAQQLNDKIAEELANLNSLNVKRQLIRAIYVIWKNPFMVAGSDTFINEMLKLSGFENACPDRRYPEINISEIIKGNPEMILLSSEPFPFSQKDALEIQDITKIKTVVVDGEMFSWYGSRPLKAIEYFKRLHLELEQ